MPADSQHIVCMLLAGKRKPFLIYTGDCGTGRREVSCAVRSGSILRTGRTGSRRHFWYEAALHAPKKTAGGFVQVECYGYVPCIQLSVCYDRMGEKKKHMSVIKWRGNINPMEENTGKMKNIFVIWNKNDYGKVCIL